MKRVFVFVFAAFAWGQISVAQAIDTTLPLEFAGQSVSLPLAVTVTPLGDGGTEAPVEARLGVHALIPAINALANAEARAELSHRGTNLWAVGGVLRAKVHLHYDPSEWYLPSTNGSVTVDFRGHVEGAAISVSAQRVELAISNDIARAAGDVTGFSDQLERQISSELARAMSEEFDILSTIPTFMQSWPLHLTSVRFEETPQGPVAVIEGVLTSRGNDG